MPMKHKHNSLNSLSFLHYTELHQSITRLHCSANEPTKSLLTSLLFLYTLSFNSFIHSHHCQNSNVSMVCSDSLLCPKLSEILIFITRLFHSYISHSALHIFKFLMIAKILHGYMALKTKTSNTLFPILGGF